MYPLVEINQKLDKLQEEMYWQDEKIDKIDQTIIWLMQFTKLVKPFVDQLPTLHQTIINLQMENERLRNRQENTAIVHGVISRINAGANPRIIYISDGKLVRDLHVNEILFEQINPQVGQVITAEARIAGHQPPGRRQPRIVFGAISIEIIGNSIDDISENGYNDN